jgi:hypothetical protein
VYRLIAIIALLSIGSTFPTFESKINQLERAVAVGNPPRVVDFEKAFLRGFDWSGGTQFVNSPTLYSEEDLKKLDTLDDEKFKESIKNMMKASNEEIFRRLYDRSKCGGRDLFYVAGHMNENFDLGIMYSCERGCLGIKIPTFKSQSYGFSQFEELMAKMTIQLPESICKAIL